MEVRASAHHRPIWTYSEGFEYEHSCWDPKEIELYVNRMKPEETLVKVRSGSDVQIDRQICVWGRKTNRNF